MNIAVSVLIGMCWGTAAAFAGSRLLKKALEKKDVRYFNRMNTLKIIVDVAAIAVLFFLRNVLPFNSVAAMFGTAVAVSVLSTVFSFKIAAAGQTVKADAAETGNENAESGNSASED